MSGSDFKDEEKALKDAREAKAMADQAAQAKRAEAVRKAQAEEAKKFGEGDQG